MDISVLRRRRRGLSDSGEYTPLNVGNCQLWLSSRRGITLSGSDVSAWLDQSTNKHVVTPIDAPTFTAANSNFNNKPTVNLNGTSEFFQIDTAATTMSGNDIPFVWMNVIRHHTAFGATLVINCVGRNSSSEYCFLGTAATGNPRVDRDDSSTAASSVEGTPASVLDTNYIYVMRYNGTTVDVWRNGTKLTGLDNAALDKLSMTLDRYALGCFRRTTNTNFAPINIAEHALFVSPPPLSALNKLQKEWGKIYGISTIALA